jgi:hypothetical protein
MLTALMRDVQDQDRVRLVISGEGLRHISFLFMAPDDLSVERILSEIERVAQSNYAWIFGGEFSVNFVHDSLPIRGMYLRGIANLNRKVLRKIMLR